ncbi:MAG: right-handed parallel beta-helix repeat-containing protein [Planctomycetota bacterium]
MTFIALLPFAIGCQAMAADYYVSPRGDDGNPGTEARPFATVARARDAVRRSGRAGRTPITVHLRGGTYYLQDTVRLTPEDSGSERAPVVYSGVEGETAVISGGRRLDLRWEPHRDGIMKARVPEGLTTDQLFVNGKLQPMARYPNFNPAARFFNGFAPDCISPARAARWKDPTGGFIHTMHGRHWGSYHCTITGKNEKNEVQHVGGFQHQWDNEPMHRRIRFVEHIFEELDAEREWWLDAKRSTLYYYPPEGLDLGEATVEVERLERLIELEGSERAPVRHVAIRDLTMTHTLRTFMKAKEKLNWSDWTIARTGAVVFNGTEDCRIEACRIDQVGGNAVFVNGYNRRVTVRGCHISETGASGVAFVGEKSAVRPRVELKDFDSTPGPKSNEYPADCLVEDCLIHRIGRVEKQVAGVQMSMSRRITTRHCSIYDTPRAGINISDGNWGGHLIEFCDIFNTVLETSDHGAFNAWGRDRYWNVKGLDMHTITKGENKDYPFLDAVELTVIRNSRWRCDHGWDIDLDDGSSNYRVYNNLCLKGGIKFREGFYRTCENNITVGNSMHLHCWYGNSEDVFRNNIVYRPYRPIRMRDWGKEFDRNLIHSPGAAEEPAVALQRMNRREKNSIKADAMFVDPDNLDYRVKEGSPALKLGFKNFPMEGFGVVSPKLKALAKTPEAPALATPGGPAALPTAAPFYWQRAVVKPLTGRQYSAFGISKESGGLHVLEVPAGSFAAKAGIRKNGLVQKINGVPIRTLADLRKVQGADKCEVGFFLDHRTSTIRMREFLSIRVRDRDVVPPSGVSAFGSVSMSHKTGAEPPERLFDGKLGTGYGPVFGNGTMNGVYTLTLKEPSEVTEVRTYSHNFQGKRGSQYFLLCGNGDKRVPLCTVDTRATVPGGFQLTVVKAHGGPMGRFRRLLWEVYPVTPRNENTAFQEFQAR